MALDRQVDAHPAFLLRMKNILIQAGEIILVFEQSMAEYWQTQELGSFRDPELAGDPVPASGGEPMHCTYFEY
jgi:hypothetical protein